VAACHVTANPEGRASTVSIAIRAGRTADPTPTPAPAKTSTTTRTSRAAFIAERMVPNGRATETYDFLLALPHWLRT
jgi:hypothetical protein